MATAQQHKSPAQQMRRISLNNSSQQSQQSPPQGHGLVARRKSSQDSSLASSLAKDLRITDLEDVNVVGTTGSDNNKSLVTLNRSNVPIPAKCSEQLRKLIHSHSLTQPPTPPPPPTLANWHLSPPMSVDGAVGAGSSNLCSFDDGDCSGNDDNRPIFPNLPYSPYASPASSPRIRRKPLRETTRVNSITESSGEYIQLNQYKLEDNIGMGSYGIVKLAYNKEDDSQYAMKILSKKKLKRKAGIFAARGLPNRRAPSGAIKKMAEEPLQKVYREIAIMKKLDHPNVVKLVEVLDDPEDENLYMAFEFLEGGEVIEIPTDNPMDEKAAWLAFRDVILGLEYLHYQKIIHRDIKPSNLLRTTTDEVKIADLGVSNEFHGHDAYLTNTAGTPAFTPPESLSHKPGDDPYSGRAADIWSLGVTLYCLVVGKVPFFDDNILSLYNKIRTQPFEFPEDKDLSPEIRDLISRMLVKDPAQRMTLPEIKVHDWVTAFGLYPLPSEEENCDLIEITDLDVDNSVRTVPKLNTLILVKTMIKNQSFTNPFKSLRSRFQKEGRSNSAPEVSFYESDSDCE